MKLMLSSPSGPVQQMLNAVPSAPEQVSEQVAQFRERIFERFYRAPDLKDAVLGAGIGLSVVRKAAEAHHGHVWAISNDKEGTTFFLSLPDGARRSQ
jgi:signal transduction histidine kinase